MLSCLILRLPCPKSNFSKFLCLLSQSISCSVLCTCSAIADFSVLPNLMASQCSFFLTPSALSVSPIYSSLHVAHFTAQTTFLLFSSSSLSFTLFSPLDLRFTKNTHLSPAFHAILHISSLRPSTYGMQTVLLSCSFSFSLSLLCRMARRYQWMRRSRYANRASARILRYQSGQQWMSTQSHVSFASA